MAIVELQDNFTKYRSIEYSLAKDGAGTTDTLLLPDGLKGLVALNLQLRAAGTAKVQFSLSPRNSHITGGTVYWMDWPKGDVTATTQDATVPVTALRIVVTSGNWTLEVRGE